MGERNVTPEPGQRERGGVPGGRLHRSGHGGHGRGGEHLGRPGNGVRQSGPT